MKVACVQTNSGNDVAANIARVDALVGEAVREGAELVALPENAFLMEESGARRTLYKQQDHPAVLASSLMARSAGIWLLVGSISIKSGQERKALNRSLLFSPDGEVAAYYDKIHLFDVDVGDGQTYKESARIVPGEKAVVARVDIERWREGGVEKKNTPSPHIPTSPHPPLLGMTICYDVRFPHLYRTLAKEGAQILSVPAAFTQVTGEAHWHVLLRARAIENGCFVIAPAQTGLHPGGRRTYGHALIVDPWGKVLADAGTEEGVIAADLDLDLVQHTRARLPSLQHDREFK